jgi:RNA polymerase sigma factor (sigma-70 family)
MTRTSDRELWRRATDGETEAFGVLFDRHAKAVYNFLFRRTGNWSEAEDLTSAVFLQAWRRRAEVVLDRESALPWLLRTADYTVRNEWRSKRRYRNSLPSFRLLVTDQPDHADDVSARLDDQREAKVLRQALRKLPKHEREVIELCSWAGLDQQAAAIALDIPVGTVKSRLSRARKRLRDLTAADLPTDDPTEIAL